MVNVFKSLLLLYLICTTITSQTFPDTDFDTIEIWEKIDRVHGTQNNGYDDLARTLEKKIFEKINENSKFNIPLSNFEEQ
jgi:hypothetical protein